MDNKEACKSKEACHTPRCKIIGAIMLVIATILTLITLNGLAIFGMFVVGLVFCCHQHFMSKCCCVTSSSCCDVEKTVAPEKKTKASA